MTAAGIYNAPVAFPLLIEQFESSGALKKLRPFTTENGRRFYGLPPSDPTDTIELVKQDEEVSPAYLEGQVVPFWAGRKLAWRLAE